MRIIEKIEIKHFRSFLGTPKPYQTEASRLTHLNVFSGANDSGKSNVLRALNLFFNDEIASGIAFDFNRDFFIGKKDAGHKVIEIAISFDLSEDKKRDKFLPEKFKISKFYDRNGFRNYTYSFPLKAKEVRIDSRAEQNAHVADLFLPANPTEVERNNAAKREWNYRVKFAGFLNKSVSFEYVPAIRDRHFFSHLFGRVISQIKHNEDKKNEAHQKEKQKIIEWRKTVKNKSESKDFLNNLSSETWRSQRIIDIDNEKIKSRLNAAIISLESEINEYSMGLIKSVDFISSEFKIGQNLRSFFEGFDIGTGDEKTVSLKLRGDGVQAKFVPKILDFISSIDSEKKYFLWGFEEPENSAEYRNQQELAKEFKEGFSTRKQIFITTHSEEFLQLYDGADVRVESRASNLYHVKKIKDDDHGEYSQIYMFDVDSGEFEFANQSSQLQYDLGQSYLTAKHSKELKAREVEFFKEKEAIRKENEALVDKLRETTKPLFFVEDSYDELYKLVWLKLYDQVFTDDNFSTVFNKVCPFSIFKAEGADCLAGFLRAKNIEHFRGRKVLGLFDFDQEGVKQFKSLKNETYWNATNDGTKVEGLLRKRRDHDCFYAMLTPIHNELSSLADMNWPSFIEIENLLPLDFLKSNDFVNEKVTTGNTTYWEIKKDKKNKIWKKIAGMDKSELKNFVPLYRRIYQVFGL